MPEYKAPQDVIFDLPQERITGDILRGRGPRRGNLERLLRYWRPIMRKPGGFRRCLVILADHPELYPLERICAWLHHETTGKWPNEGNHHGTGRVGRAARRAVRRVVKKDAIRSIRGEGYWGEDANWGEWTYALSESRSKGGPLTQPIAGRQALIDYKAMAFKAGSRVGHLIQSLLLPGERHMFRVNPIRSAAYSLAFPGGRGGGGLGVGLPGLGGGGGGVGRGIGGAFRGYRCPSGYEHGGRFTNRAFANCGRQLFDLPGRKPSAGGSAREAVERTARSIGNISSNRIAEALTSDRINMRSPLIPPVGRDNSKQQDAAVKKIVAGMRKIGASRSDTDFQRLIRRDGSVLSPTAPLATIAKQRNNADLEGGVFVRRITSPKNIGVEEVPLLGTGIRQLVLVAPGNVEVRITPKGKLTRNDRATLSRLLNNARKREEYGELISQIAEELQEQMSVNLSNAGRRDPNAMVEVVNPNGERRTVPYWVFTTFLAENAPARPKDEKPFEIVGGGGAKAYPDVSYKVQRFYAQYDVKQNSEGGTWGPLSYTAAPIVRGSYQSFISSVAYKAWAFKDAQMEAGIQFKGKVFWDPFMARYRCSEGFEFGGRITNRWGAGCGIALVRQLIGGARRAVNRFDDWDYQRHIGRTQRRMRRITQGRREGRATRARRSVGRGLARVGEAIGDAMQRADVPGGFDPEMEGRPTRALLRGADALEGGARRAIRRGKPKKRVRRVAEALASVALPGERGIIRAALTPGGDEHDWTPLDLEILNAPNPADEIRTALEWADRGEDDDTPPPVDLDIADVEGLRRDPERRSALKRIADWFDNLFDKIGEAMERRDVRGGFDDEMEGRPTRAVLRGARRMEPDEVPDRAPRRAAREVDLTPRETPFERRRAPARAPGLGAAPELPEEPRRRRTGPPRRERRRDMFQLGNRSVEVERNDRGQVVRVKGEGEEEWRNVLRLDRDGGHIFQDNGDGTYSLVYHGDDGFEVLGTSAMVDRGVAEAALWGHRRDYIRHREIRREMAEGIEVRDVLEEFDGPDGKYAARVIEGWDGQPRFALYKITGEGDDRRAFLHGDYRSYTDFDEARRGLGWDGPDRLERRRTAVIPDALGVPDAADLSDERKERWHRVLDRERDALIDLFATRMDVDRNRVTPDSVDAWIYSLNRDQARPMYRVWRNDLHDLWGRDDDRLNRVGRLSLEVYGEVRNLVDRDDDDLDVIQRARLRNLGRVPPGAVIHDPNSDLRVAAVTYSILDTRADARREYLNSYVEGGGIFKIDRVGYVVVDEHEKNRLTQLITDGLVENVSYEGTPRRTEPLPEVPALSTENRDFLTSRVTPVMTALNLTQDNPEARPRTREMVMGVARARNLSLSAESINEIADQIVSGLPETAPAGGNFEVADLSSVARQNLLLTARSVSDDSAAYWMARLGVDRSDLTPELIRADIERTRDRGGNELADSFEGSLQRFMLGQGTDDQVIERLRHLDADRYNEIRTAADVLPTPEPEAPRPAGAWREGQEVTPEVLEGFLVAARDHGQVAGPYESYGEAARRAWSTRPAERRAVYETPGGYYVMSEASAATAATRIWDADTDEMAPGFRYRGTPISDPIEAEAYQAVMERVNNANPYGAAIRPQVSALMQSLTTATDPEQRQDLLDRAEALVIHGIQLTEVNEFYPTPTHPSASVRSWLGDTGTNDFLAQLDGAIRGYRELGEPDSLQRLNEGLERLISDIDQYRTALSGHPDATRHQNRATDFLSELRVRRGEIRTSRLGQGDFDGPLFQVTRLGQARMNEDAFEPIWSQPYSNGLRLQPTGRNGGGMMDLHVIDDANDETVGSLTFYFTPMRGPDGSPDGRVEMNAGYMSIGSETQGTGLATELIGRMMALQNENPQIGRITVSANISVGGYAWGNYFDMDYVPETISDRMAVTEALLDLLGSDQPVSTSNLPFEIRSMLPYSAVSHAMVPGSSGTISPDLVATSIVRDIVRGYENNSDEIAQRIVAGWRENRDELLSLVREIRQRSHREPNWTLDLANLGKHRRLNSGEAGATYPWHIGKLILIGSHWSGTISVDDTDEWRERRQGWEAV